jgi:trk system potassium uptake protein
VAQVFQPGFLVARAFEPVPERMARPNNPPEPTAPPRDIPGMNAVLAVAGLAGLAAIVLEYGFREGVRPVETGRLHVAVAAAVAIFVLDWLARLALAPRPAEFFGRNWGRPAMMGLAALSPLAGFLGLTGLATSTGTPPYALVLQAYLCAELLLRSPGLLRLPLLAKIGPAWGLIGGFALLCLAGAGLLMLPVATPEPTSSQAKVLFFWDALFTSVSAASATGLTVRDTGRQFTPFGQVVILVLIQVGSLAVMVFGSAAAVLVGRGLARSSCRRLTAIAEEPPGPGQIRRLARFIIATTLAVEAVGAAMIYPMFAAAPDVDGGTMSAASAIWHSVFHSVSAFCNAGFSLYGRGMMAGVDESVWGEPLRDHWQMLGVLSPLIVLGGVGFPVLADCGAYAWARCRSLWAQIVRPDERPAQRPAQRPADRRADRPTIAPGEAGLPGLSPHSRVVLWMTGVLIFVGAVGLVAVEPWPGGPGPAEARHPIGGGAGGGGDWDDMQLPRRLREGLVLSVSARTGGFNTIDIRELSDAGKWWTCGLMIVGGSPGGSAGGMKTVTVFLMVAAVWSFLRRRKEVEAPGGPASFDLVRRAVSAAVLYLALLGLVTLGVTILMRPGYSFMDLFFESCSACGNVGLSTGVTTSLNDAAKMVLTGGMLIGRLGVLTLLLAPHGRERQGDMIVVWE